MANLVGTRGKFGVISANTPHPIGSVPKRLIDILFALSGIFLLAPLLIFCFVATALSSPGPVLFRHRRVGFNGKHFECLKFRTMVPDASERLQRLLDADPTAAAEMGALLRRSSLDELPQLFNVLRGEMSIVGPRPVTEDELVRYAGAVSHYLACRPGITGLWQVSGRSTTTYVERVEYDAFYAQNWSMALDAKILIITIPALLSEGAY